MCGEWVASSYKFLSVLVHCQMHSTKQAPSNLMFHNVLIDAMLSLSIILAVCILGMRIESFL